MIVSSTFLLESGKPKRTLSNPEQLQQAGWIDENIANMIAGVSTRKLSTTVENLEHFKTGSLADRDKVVFRTVLHR